MHGEKGCCSIISVVQLGVGLVSHLRGYPYGSLMLSWRFSKFNFMVLELEEQNSNNNLFTGKYLLADICKCFISELRSDESTSKLVPSWRYSPVVYICVHKL